jgi:hypothetical protein
MCPYVAGIEQDLFNGACVPKCPSGATRDVSGVCQCSGNELVWGASTEDEGQFTAGVCPYDSKGLYAQRQCTTKTAIFATCPNGGNPSAGECVLPGPSCPAGSTLKNGLCDFLE